MQEENVGRQGRGTVQMFAGRIKRAFGRLLGHPTTEAKGYTEELRGRANVERGMAAERREGSAQEIGGTAKRVVGEAIGNERMAVEGRAKELEGQERQSHNR
jgi:uncharacterized protein YjbJ (UPF0337 family)